jgi:isopropylmalate/homocitrate/citramalate synthase
MSNIDVTTSIRGATALVAGFEEAQAAAVDATWVVGTTVEYSVYVEFGTSKMAAQPYLRPAVEAARRKADRVFERAESTDAAVKDLALLIEAEAKRRCPVDTGNLRASIRAERVS